MKKMNKKGFTLIELLAVIVVLAIVMVIATQKITDVINSSRSNAFISSYKMIVKQINTNIVADPNNITCSSKEDCQKKYDISDDYDLTVTDDTTNNKYIITLKVKSTGKFKNMNLEKYGDASKSESKDTYSCDASKIGSGATECNEQQIKGSVAK